MKQVQTSAALRKKIRTAFESGGAATVEQMARTSPPVEGLDVPLPEAPES
jgi:hypothetical protein